jgi:hypothetical protein
VAWPIKAVTAPSDSLKSVLKMDAYLIGDEDDN